VCTINSFPKFSMWTLQCLGSHHGQKYLEVSMSMSVVFNLLLLTPCGIDLQFLGILEDSSAEMRKGVHELLSSISLPSIATFRSTFRAILNSLDKHPEVSFFTVNLRTSLQPQNCIVGHKGLVPSTNLLLQLEVSGVLMPFWGWIFAG
jgi:hypothetical protein